MQRAADALGCDSSGCVLTHLFPFLLHTGLSQVLASGQVSTLWTAPKPTILAAAPGPQHLCSEVDLDICITLVLF